MGTTSQTDSQPSFPADLAEVERQIKLWSSNAAKLGPNIMAFGAALSVDGSQILFKGDLIVFSAPAGRGSDVVVSALDLASIRKIVCNLKILQTRREQLEGKKATHISYP
jgi:hypothetical protein